MTTRTRWPGWVVAGWSVLVVASSAAMAGCGDDAPADQPACVSGMPRCVDLDGHTRGPTLDAEGNVSAYSCACGVLVTWTFRCPAGAAAPADCTPVGDPSQECSPAGGGPCSSVDSIVCLDAEGPSCSTIPTGEVDALEFVASFCAVGAFPTAAAGTVECVAVVR